MYVCKYKCGCMWRLWMSKCLLNYIREVYTFENSFWIKLFLCISEIMKSSMDFKNEPLYINHYKFTIINTKINPQGICITFNRRCVILNVENKIAIAQSFIKFSSLFILDLWTFNSWIILWHNCIQWFHEKHCDCP